MRLKPVHYATLRDIYFLTVCAALFVMMATSVLWIYANFFAPKEKARRLAEPGTFYLRTYASVRTAHGVVGIPAGEQVHRVNDKATQAGMLKVTDGQYVFEVPPFDLTDDLDLAESIGASDGEAQRLLCEQASSDQWEAQRARAVYESSRASDAAMYGAQMKSSSVIGTLVSPLNGGASRVIGASSSGPWYENNSHVTNNVVVNASAAANTGGGASNPAPINIRYLDDPLTRLRKEAGTSLTTSPGY